LLISFVLIGDAIHACRRHAKRQVEHRSEKAPISMTFTQILSVNTMVFCTLNVYFLILSLWLERKENE